MRNLVPLLLAGLFCTGCLQPQPEPRVVLDYHSQETSYYAIYRISGSCPISMVGHLHFNYTANEFQSLEILLLDSERPFKPLLWGYEYDGGKDLAGKGVVRAGVLNSSVDAPAVASRMPKFVDSLVQVSSNATVGTLVLLYHNVVGETSFSLTTFCSTVEPLGEGTPFATTLFDLGRARAVAMPAGGVVLQGHQTLGEPGQPFLLSISYEVGEVGRGALRITSDHQDYTLSLDGTPNSTCLCFTNAKIVYADSGVQIDAMYAGYSRNTNVFLVGVPLRALSQPILQQWPWVGNGTQG